MVKGFYLFAMGCALSVSGAAHGEPCLALRGTLVQDSSINEIAVHSRLAQDGVTEYAFGEAPLTYFRADGILRPAQGTLEQGMVRLTCGPKELFAIEQSLDGSSSSLRIRKAADVEAYDVEGTGLYEVGTGRYRLRQF